MKRFIDITQELFGAEPYPGDPAPVRYSVKTVARDGYALTAFYACAHNGTHIDAPCHFIENGGDVCAIAPEKCVGKCYVAETFGEALQAALDGYTRILCKGFDLTPGEAEELAPRVNLLGMDGASFGGNSAAGKVHRALLSRGVGLLENLVLENVPRGEYELIALPLKLSGSDGSPVRAVLIADA